LLPTGNVTFVTDFCEKLSNNHRAPALDPFRIGFACLRRIFSAPQIIGLSGFEVDNTSWKRLMG
jgi:hypothetical protein